MITITLPMLPPTVNHYGKRRAGGGTYLSDEVHVWRKYVWTALREVGAHTAPDGDLAITITLTYGDKRKRDIDNHIKATLDALALALDFDDHRVARLTVARAGVAPKQPVCIITIAPQNGAEAAFEAANLYRE